MTIRPAVSQESSRLSRIDGGALDPPARVIVNPRAGNKLGVSTNAAGPDAVEAALAAAGVRFESRQTQAPGHASRLAQQAVRDGCKLVVAAGGDGTVSEVGQTLVHTNVALGIMPLGSVMNVGRALGLPRDLDAAARAIADGQVLAMDVGRASDHIFLEAGGVGLDAGLLGYFGRLDSGGARPPAVFRAVLRFVRGLRNPPLVIVADGQRFDVRAPQVTIANGPYVGAAYALAPQARVDDGHLDVVIFRGMSALRVLVHMAMVAGGRRWPPPTEVQLVRAGSVNVATRRRRPLPVHVDGVVVGVTPAHFTAIPAALRVIVGQANGERAWGAY
ncbi:MAG TPA: YegS/Rv2252/BmrU family lipid kinase [Chloroflexota bacterium]